MLFGIALESLDEAESKRDEENEKGLHSDD